MNLRTLHRLSACVIAVYALVHIANHMVGLQGVAAHIAFMKSARVMYRAVPVEPVLLAAVLVQLITGIRAVALGWRERRGLVPWLQAGSGAYLAFFLLNHVGAVIYGRSVGLDTNFYFAAAGLHVAPFQYYFAPYYFLAVLALFVHLGCALYWQMQARSTRTQALAVALPTVLGAIVSLLIVLAMAGAFYRVDIPANYKSTFVFK
jgi:succinate dehydrogenase/fumarate reductase cytochrome b subunit